MEGATWLEVQATLRSTLLLLEAALRNRETARLMLIGNGAPEEGSWAAGLVLAQEEHERQLVDDHQAAQAAVWQADVAVQELADASAEAQAAAAADNGRMLRAGQLWAHAALAAGLAARSNQAPRFLARAKILGLSQDSWLELRFLARAKVLGSRPKSWLGPRCCPRAHTFGPSQDSWL